MDMKVDGEVVVVAEWSGVEWSGVGGGIGRGSGGGESGEIGEAFGGGSKSRSVKK